jgi:hypothetical protein
MNTFFNIVAHLIIIVGILVIFGFIIKMIVKQENRLERVIRVFALVAGFLIYFMSRAVGISIPDIIVKSLAGTTPLSFGIIGMLFPLILGIFAAWYCVDAMGRISNLPGRVAVLIATFILTLFTDVYVAVFKLPTANKLHTNLLPNLTFVIGLSLYMIFNVKRRSGMSSAVRQEE